MEANNQSSQAGLVQHLHSITNNAETVNHQDDDSEGGEEGEVDPDSSSAEVVLEDGRKDGSQSGGHTNEQGDYDVSQE